MTETPKTPMTCPSFDDVLNMTTSSFSDLTQLVALIEDAHAMHRNLRGDEEGYECALAMMQTHQRPHALYDATIAVAQREKMGYFIERLDNIMEQRNETKADEEPSIPYPYPTPDEQDSLERLQAKWEWEEDVAKARKERERRFDKDTFAPPPPPVPRPNNPRGHN